MKGVLISIQRPHIDKIKALLKIVEVRKSKPNVEFPFTCFIYETKAKGGCGKVIGEFVCEYISENSFDHMSAYQFVQLLKDSTLTNEQLQNYIKKDDEIFYCWYISYLKIYDKPKELSEFKIKRFVEKCGIFGFSDVKRYSIETLKRPPKSWCYVEVEE